MSSGFDPIERELDELDGDYEAAPRRRANIRWLPIVLASIALITFGVIIWYAYSQGVREGSEVAAPLLKPEGPVKVLPTNPGGMEVPHQDNTVFNTIDGREDDTRVERLLPPPEQPREPPSAPRQLAGEGSGIRVGPSISSDRTGDSGAGTQPSYSLAPQMDSSAQSAPLAGQGVAEQGATEQAAPGDAAAGDSALVAPAEAPPLPSPNLKKPEAVPSADTVQPAQRASLAGKFKIQVGAVRSDEAAQRHWAQQVQQHRQILGGLTMDVERAEVPGKGTFFRVQAGPFPNRAEAQKVCDALKERKAGCYVVSP